VVKNTYIFVCRKKLDGFFFIKNEQIHERIPRKKEENSSGGIRQIFMKFLQKIFREIWAIFLILKDVV
jgi:hypothetical protein